MKKISYTISCATRFRDEVMALATRRHVNPGDLARSVLLMLSTETIDGFEDPGEPGEHDRETITLKSGPAAGKLWQRKPRLQVRLPAGFDAITIRKALGLALLMDKRQLMARLEHPDMQLRRDAEAERLRAAVQTLSFDILEGGVQTHADALYVFGFHPSARPDRSSLRMRFRMLAAIHHPDGDVGDHRRMAQLNAAMDILRPAAA